MESKEKEGDRWLRLGDLVPHEVIVVRCLCGRSVEYHKGFLQRRHHLTSSSGNHQKRFIAVSHGFRLSHALLPIGS
jgi:hypothetical protein